MDIFKKLFICVTLFIAGVSYPHSRVSNLNLLRADGKIVSVSVEVADNEESREAGLMFRRILGENEGMLFVFEDSALRSFWMNNTYIPLSIAYIGDNMTINEIYDMKPLDTSIIYYSKKPARYALEMKQGWFARNGITVGNKIAIIN